MTSFSWRGGFCVEDNPIPNTVVIFGASGDLTHRKLIPALFNLFCGGLLHENTQIVGCARSEMDDAAFRNKVRETLDMTERKCERADEFLSKVYYLSGQYDQLETYENLSARLAEIEGDKAPEMNRVYYLSTPVYLYEIIVDLLGQSGLVAEDYDGKPWRHVIIEKPFGRDLKSSQELDRKLHRVLAERQIFRIDHYLGKETVQNILMMRFANTIFEPIWNNHYVDHVQITVAESIGVEHRAGYYERAGLLRDMFQNHMLEMLSLVAMESPPSFDPHAVRDEKEKLLNSIRPFPVDDLGNYFVRGQYANAGDICGYREEEGVAADSNTETFVAAKFMIDNWRWEGVPFYMRSGKRLPKRVSEIAITFKQVPHSIFNPIKAEDLEPNVLVLNVQPEEGMALTIQSKQPGPKLCMGSLTLDFRYADLFEGKMPDAYERLLIDCMHADQTLFIRSDSIQIAWRLLTPVLEAWEQQRGDDSTIGPVHPYQAGTWGPDAADMLLYRDGKRIWRNG